jgi:hypothetical protein
VQRVKPWEKDAAWRLDTEGRWTIDGLAKAVADAGVPQGAGWTANPDKA